MNPNPIITPKRLLYVALAILIVVMPILAVFTPLCNAPPPTLVDPPGAISGTFNIVTGADDGRRFDATFLSGDTLMAFGFIGTSELDQFMRFSSVTIPKDATITYARIDMYAQGAQSGSVVRTKIQAVKEPDPTTIISIADWDGRVFTTSVTDWDGVDGWLDNTLHDTDEGTQSGDGIVGVIQEIVNQEDWSINNHIIITIENDVSTSGAYRICDSYDLVGSDGPELYVEWETVAPPTVTTQEATLVGIGNATLHGNITSLNDGGNADITGFVFNEGSDHGDPGNVSPALSDWNDNGAYNVETTGQSKGVGTFSEYFDDFDDNTEINFRAYAHTSQGWGYGDVQTFTTLPAPPPFPLGYPTRFTVTIPADAHDLSADLIDFTVTVCLDENSFGGDWTRVDYHGDSIWFQDEFGVTISFDGEDEFDWDNKRATFPVILPIFHYDRDTLVYAYYRPEYSRFETLIDLVKIEATDATSTTNQTPITYVGPIAGGAVAKQPYIKDAGIVDSGAYTSDGVQEIGDDPQKDINNKDTNDFELLPGNATINDGDAFSMMLWYGSDRIFFNIGTAMVNDTGWTITWQYYASNSTWQNFDDVVDGTNGFANSTNWTTVKWTEPTDWDDKDPYGANGETGHWLRAVLSGFTKSNYTQPLGTEAWIDRWDEEGTYTAVLTDLDWPAESRYRFFLQASDIEEVTGFGTWYYSADLIRWYKWVLNEVAYPLGGSDTSNNMQSPPGDRVFQSVYRVDDSVWVNTEYNSYGIAAFGEEPHGGDPGMYLWGVVEDNLCGLGDGGWVDTGIELTNAVDGTGDTNFLELRPDGRIVVLERNSHGAGVRDLALQITKTSDLDDGFIDFGIIMAGDTDSQPYSMKSERHGDYYYGLLDRYNKTADTFVAELWASRNGVTDWVELNSAFIEPGAEGSWDQGLISASLGWQHIDDDWWIPYIGREWQHDDPDADFNYIENRLGFKTIRFMGFGSMKSTGGEKYLTTTPIIVTDNNLFANFIANGTGDKIEVELLDLNDSVITGFSQADCVDLTGDSVSTRVEWTGGNFTDAGEVMVKIKFYITHANDTAELFAYTIGTEGDCLVDLSVHETTYDEDYFLVQHMTKNSSPSFEDMTNYSNDPEDIGADVIDVAGKIGRAADLPGNATGYLDFAFTNSGIQTLFNDVSTKGSFEAWISLDSVSGNYTIGSFWNHAFGGGFDIFRWRVEDDEIAVRMSLDGNSADYINEKTDAANLQIDTWYNVGISIDLGLAKESRIKIYVNGVLEASTTTDAADGPTVFGDGGGFTDFFIGAVEFDGTTGSGAFAWPFDGTIDEFWATSNVVRSADYFEMAYQRGNCSFMDFLSTSSLGLTVQAASYDDESGNSTFNGTLIDEGGSTVDNLGFVYDIVSHPPPSGLTTVATSEYAFNVFDSCTPCSLGAFLEIIESLPPDTYYIRAAGNNTSGYGWSPTEVIFKISLLGGIRPNIWTMDGFF